MSYINKEELIKQLKEEIQNIWHLSCEAGAYVSYDSTKSKVNEVYNIIEIVNKMPVIEDIKPVDSDNEELINAENRAFDRFSKTDLYKSILGISMSKADIKLEERCNNFNKWLDEDIDE